MAPKHLENVDQIIAVHSAKGGVGKSTLTVNLAVGLAQRGFKVGLLDADVHGPSGALMMGSTDWPDPAEDANDIHPITAHGVKFISMGNLVTRQTPLIWRGAMVHSVINQFFNNVLWGELDYLILDMPPGTGDALLSVAQAVPLTGVVTISTPQELSMVDTIRGIRGFEQLRVPILGLVENMSYFVCDDCGDRAELFGESMLETMGEELSLALLGRIPIDPAVCQSGDAGKPLVLSHPESATTAAVNQVLDNVLKAVEQTKSAAAFDIAWRQLSWHERVAEPPAERRLNDDLVSAVWQVSMDELGVLWTDGEQTIFSVRELRLACPCAACCDEWTGQRILKPEEVPADISMSEITSVGRYAINPVFTDGHRSGIFHFNRLKELAQAKSVKS